MTIYCVFLIRGVKRLNHFFVSFAELIEALSSLNTQFRLAIDSTWFITRLCIHVTYEQMACAYIDMSFCRPSRKAILSLPPDEKEVETIREAPPS